MAASATHVVSGDISAKKVWIFKVDGSGNVPTTATAVIDGYTEEDFFGNSLALSATHLVVGGGPFYGHMVQSRKLWIFKIDGAGNVPTTHTAVIDPPSYRSYNSHNTPLGLSATHLVVGDPDAKKAYIFKVDGAGNLPTTATAEINSYTGETLFATSLALSATNLVIGTKTKAWIFKVDGTGEIPTTATATLGTGETFPEDLEAMDLSSNHLVLGFPSASTFLPDGGQVWIYKIDGAGNIPTTTTGILDATQWPYEGTTPFVEFGKNLALSDSYLAVGDYSRTTHVYKKDGSGALPTDPFAAVVDSAPLFTLYNPSFTNLCLTDDRLVIAFHNEIHIYKNN